jgi:leucyl-tRNA synthetase
MNDYNFKDIEKKYQNLWDFSVEKNNKPKYYVLSMFPYPSGKLHMGHLRNYVIGDVVARFKRARGFNVLHPIGWDAFGLPAENAAIEHKIHPKTWTEQNIKKMSESLKRIGLSYDWRRELKTCDPEYFKHEQKFFLDFFKNGLAYKKESEVNWDPVDKTVLANEQVVDGKGWRSGAKVEKKKLNQWFLKITDFADELLSELKTLKDWPDKVKTMQENWIHSLRDWGVSRQRYWGCPIPIIYCETCGIQPVPEKDLPVKLPDDIDLEKLGNPLDNHPTWKHTECPKCGNSATRDTDTFDTFFESSWYFAAFCGINNGINKDLCDYFLPVDTYIGGIEHAVMHLLYARFFTKALKKFGYLNLDEPFKQLITQGMVCHRTYKDANSNWLFPEEAQELIKQGKKVEIGSIEKMSKSKKNTIDPETIIDKYGADTARFFILSDNPPENDFEWSNSGVESTYKHIKKIIKIVESFLESKTDYNSIPDNNLQRKLHKILYDLTEHIENVRLNCAIAKIHELANLCNTEKSIQYEGIPILIRVLEPFVPHLAEYLSEKIGNESLIYNTKWPESYKDFTVEDKIKIAIQINSKFKISMEIDKNADQKTVEVNALKLLKKEIEVKKVIFIHDKVINFIS